MKKNLKKTLAISGATLMTAMSLGVGVTTAHADTYQDVLNKWNNIIYPGSPYAQACWQRAQEGDPDTKLMFDNNGKLLSLPEIYARGEQHASIELQNVDKSTIPSASLNNNSSSNTTTNNTTSVNNGAKAVSSNTNTAVNNASTASNNSTSASTPASSNNTTYVATKNNAGMKTLPQTGNENGAATTALGLSLATIASMFGLANLKRHFA